MWGFQNRVCLSVCPHPEKRYHHSFVNISPTLVIDTSMEWSSRVLHHGNPKIWIFFFQKSSKFEFWLLTKCWNHLSFVNISPTLVIDMSTERSSRVLQHGNQKIWFFFFKKVRNWIRLVFWLVLKSWNEHSSRSQQSTCTYMSTSGMHRRPFEGRHLVLVPFHLIFESLFFCGIAQNKAPSLPTHNMTITFFYFLPINSVSIINFNACFLLFELNNLWLINQHLCKKILNIDI